MIGQNNSRFYKEKEKGRSKQPPPQWGKQEGMHDSNFLFMEL